MQASAKAVLLTITTKTNLVCRCGHTGVHIHSQSGQPSGEPWDHYRLEGFSGGGPSCDDLPSIFCPTCGEIGTVIHDPMQID